MVSKQFTVAGFTTLLVLGLAFTAPAAYAVSADKAESSAEGDAQEYSEGMNIPVDGSSLEAFEKSLEAIKPQVTEAEFTSLENAIDYLLIYDLAARRNKERLAKNLDGMTGAEIIDQVQW